MQYKDQIDLRLFLSFASFKVTQGTQTTQSEIEKFY